MKRKRKGGGGTLKTFQRYIKASNKKQSPISQKTAYRLYRLTGMIEEMGELAGKIKRLIRDSGGRLTEKARLAIGYELGDILWYFTDLARRFGFTIEEIMELNMRKLKDREKRGKIKGSGDNR